MSEAQEHARRFGATEPITEAQQNDAIKKLRDLSGRDNIRDMTIGKLIEGRCLCGFCLRYDMSQRIERAMRARGQDAMADAHAELMNAFCEFECEQDMKEYFDKEKADNER